MLKYRRMNKKVFHLFIFCAIFALFSCAKSSDTENISTADTLKAAAEQKFSQIKWTDELEKDRLVKNISTVNTVEKNIQISPAVFINSSYSENLAPVYPVLEGFGSLDVSKLKPEIKKMTEQFAQSLCTAEIDSSLFDSADIYEGALFEKDLKDSWKTSFAEDFPELKTEEKTEESEKSETAAEEGKSAEAEMPAESEKTAEKQKLILFEDYILGEPFEMNSLYEVPVRFVTQKKQKVDIIIYFYKNEKSSWKIDQLKIVRMLQEGETYGE